jgi:hypothetical protein
MPEHTNNIADRNSVAIAHCLGIVFAHRLELVIEVWNEAHMVYNVSKFLRQTTFPALRAISIVFWRRGLHKPLLIPTDLEAPTSDQVLHPDVMKRLESVSITFHNVTKAYAAKLRRCFKPFFQEHMITYKTSRNDVVWPGGRRWRKAHDEDHL